MVLSGTYEDWWRHGAVRGGAARGADPEQPELPLSFKGGKDIQRHFNLRMVKGAVA